MVGLYTQQVFVMILLFICLPASIGYLFAAPLLKALGQQPEVADRAAIFAYISWPALFLNAASTPLMTTIAILG